MNTLILDALRGKNHSGQTPIWLMRQAGRYMPEYRAFRERYSFLEMCKTPEIAAQVTTLPITQFEMDAAILFSDILVIPDAFEVGLSFEEKKGPIIKKALQNDRDLDALPSPDIIEKLSYVAQAIHLLKNELNVPLIGFSGAPFTLAAYMIEGTTSKTWKQTKKWLFQRPDSFHRLLDILSDAIVDYLNMQIDAGVDAIQLFDSWAHALDWDSFSSVSMHYVKKIISRLKKTDIPIIFFCKGSSTFAPLMAQTGAHAISLDWNADLSSIRKKLGTSIALQGNLDPDVLYAPKETIQRKAESLLVSMQDDPGFIFNLGHGIMPDVSPNAVQTLVETVKNACIKR